MPIGNVTERLRRAAKTVAEAPECSERIMMSMRQKGNGTRMPDLTLGSTSRLYYGENVHAIWQVLYSTLPTSH